MVRVPRRIEGQPATEAPTGLLTAGISVLTIAVILNFVAVVMMAAMAVKYLFGPAPADYHAEVLHVANVDINETTTLLFAAINKVYGGSFLSIALAVLIVTIFGVMQDAFWAKALVAAIGCIAGIPITLAAREVEWKTGVATPWRAAAGMTGVLLVAFLLSLLE